LFIPKREWLADLEEQARRRLQDTMGGLQQTGQDLITGAQGQIDQAAAEAQRRKEEYARSLMEQALNPIREAGAEAAQGLARFSQGGQQTEEQRARDAQREAEERQRQEEQARQRQQAQEAFQQGPVGQALGAAQGAGEAVGHRLGDLGEAAQGVGQGAGQGFSDLGSSVRGAATDYEAWRESGGPHPTPWDTLGQAAAAGAAPRDEFARTSPMAPLAEQARDLTGAIGDVVAPPFVAFGTSMGMTPEQARAAAGSAFEQVGGLVAPGEGAAERAGAEGLAATERFRPPTGRSPGAVPPGAGGEGLGPTARDALRRARATGQPPPPEVQRALEAAAETGGAPPPPPPEPPPPTTFGRPGDLSTAGQPPPMPKAPGRLDWVRSGRYASLLSNPGGVLGDALSGPVEGLWKGARDVATETGGALTGRGGHPLLVARAEAAAVADGWRAAWGKRFGEVVAAAEREAPEPLPPGAGEEPGGWLRGLSRPDLRAAAGQSEVGPGRTLLETARERARVAAERGEAAPRVLGGLASEAGAAKAVEAVPRFRRALDSANHEVALGMDLYRRAVREALAEGASPSGPAFRDRVREIAQERLAIPEHLRAALTKPLLQRSDAERDALAQAVRDGTISPPAEVLRDGDAVLKEALGVADKLTFRNDPGPLGKAFQDLSTTDLGNVVMPFARTTANIAARGIERSPVGLGYSALRKATGHRVSQDTWADNALGSAMWVGLKQLAEGGHVTGSGPDDSRTRDDLYAQGWRPHSVRIRGRYVDYNRLGPLATPLALAGAWGDATTFRKPDANLADLAGAAAGDFTRWSRDQTVISSLGRLYQALGDEGPDVPGWLVGVAAPYVPLAGAGLGPAVASALDPYERERAGFLDELKFRVPGLRQTLPQRYDEFGEPVENPGSGPVGFLNPYRLAPRAPEETRDLRRYRDSESAAEDARIAAAVEAVERYRKRQTEIPPGPEAEELYERTRGRKDPEYERTRGRARREADERRREKEAASLGG